MIEVTALTKRYGSLTVLDGVDFAVQAGEIAAVVGPSGAGKSTLARCINLLEKPTSGSILVDGKDLTRLSRRELRSARRAIGTVFQSASLLQRMTAAENVALPLRYLDISHSERVTRVHELLDRVGMLHRANHYPAQLSGGQQQRIGLARGLALKPSVLLADEPTSGLDPQTTASILKLLAELRDELRVAVVLITHEMDVVRNVADSVARSSSVARSPRWCAPRTRSWRARCCHCLPDRRRGASPRSGNCATSAPTSTRRGSPRSVASSIPTSRYWRG
jgi:D-methionine transport system ATP-binding protein